MERRNSKLIDPLKIVFILISDLSIQKRFENQKFLEQMLQLINYISHQMVENDGATKLSQMCLKLSAVHRWCVTGTPLQRSVEDLFGLFLFLSVRPYNTKVWWKRGLIDHFNAGNFTL